MAIEVVEAVEVIEAAEVLRPGKSLLRTSESSMSFTGCPIDMLTRSDQILKIEKSLLGTSVIQVLEFSFIWMFCNNIF